MTDFYEHQAALESPAVDAQQAFEKVVSPSLTIEERYIAETYFKDGWQAAQSQPVAVKRSCYTCIHAGDGKCYFPEPCELGWHWTPKQPPSQPSPKERCVTCRWQDAPCDRCINNGYGVMTKWEPKQPPSPPSTKGAIHEQHQSKE